MTTAGIEPESPFFAPATPREEEKRSNIAGATSNLVNSVLGAGILGMPYAIKETGFVAGAFLIVLCIVMTEKSLRILIGTAKHVGVSTYERLFESTYGLFGFYFVSINMIIMAYGGCLTYLMIIKDTLPVLMGVSPGDVGMERAILSISTMAIILPISMQRDMAALAKTSKLAVLSQCFIVITIVIFSPWRSSINDNGGLLHIVSNSVVNGTTVFIGLGVMGNAFVCQHSAFLIAGSLEHPTRKRWAKVTSRALLLCGILEAACGIMGYLAFGDETEGDVLKNFLDLPSENMRRAGNAGRALICVTMFFAYPVTSLVLRHVFIVLFFHGRRAREGDDASVLNRRDRRVATTLITYFASLIPALYTENVGLVMAIAGTIAASSLAYIGPGLIYMAVYGEEFLAFVNETWGSSPPLAANNEEKPLESSSLLSDEISSKTASTSESMLEKIIKDIAWYFLLMPIWCAIADAGQRRLKFFRQKESLKSPHISRISSLPYLPESDIQRQLSCCVEENTVLFQTTEHYDDVNENRSLSDHTVLSRQLESGSQPNPGPKLLPYKAISGVDLVIAAEILAKKGFNAKKQSEAVVPADVENPIWSDFCTAIFFIVFGMIAMSAGLISFLIF